MKEKILAIVSLAVGVLAVFLSLYGFILVIPSAIVSIVLGVIALSGLLQIQRQQAEDRKSSVHFYKLVALGGIALSVISLALSVIVIIISFIVGVDIDLGFLNGAVERVRGFIESVAPDWINIDAALPNLENVNLENIVPQIIEG